MAQLDPTNPFQQEVVGLDRQRQLAQMLIKQGMEQPQGQMVSNRFVAPAWTERLANLLNIYSGQKGLEEADKKQLDMAKKLREQYGQEMQNYLDLARGREQVFEQAGPTPTGGNIPNQTYRTGGDIQAANLYGSTALNPVLQQFATKKMLEGPQWKEISQFNPQTGNTENYRYDANSTNPRETMQFLGISKPAISPEAQIRFADEGIGIPTQFRGGAVGQPTAPSPYGSNVQMTPNQSVQRQPMVGGAPQMQPQVAAPVAPTATPTVAGSKEYDPFKAPPVPAGLSGKQAREFVSDQAKPLTGKALDEVNGAVSYQKELNNLVSLFDKYKGADMLKPNVRAEIKNALRAAQLQGKEAFGLGVLNGPDLMLLEEILVDPTAFDAFLKDRSTINKLYNNQRMFTAEKIKTNYRTAQKAVPDNLREFVQIKPTELSADTPTLQTKLKALNIPYQPAIYEYRVNPDGSVDRKKKK